MFTDEDTEDQVVKEIAYRQIVSILHVSEDTIEYSGCWDGNMTRTDDITDNSLEMPLVAGGNISLSIANNTRMDGTVVNTGYASTIITADGPFTMVKIFNLKSASF